jgi:Amt family ammonium transporter
MTWLLIKGLGLLMPLRGPEQEEALGMDLTHHGEEAYASGEGAILIGVGSGAGRSPRV